MNFPVCSSTLKRSSYEGLPVFSCAQCSGYLVATRRVVEIRRRGAKSHEHLKQDAVVEGHNDSECRLRCPRCRRPMDKEFWKGRGSFRIDKCRDCELVWFDSGELAGIQREYEATQPAQDAARFRNRLWQLTPEERRELEQNLARLPEGDATLASAFGEGLMESMVELAWTLWDQQT